MGVGFSRVILASALLGGGFAAPAEGVVPVSTAISGEAALASVEASRSTSTGPLGGEAARVTTRDTVQVADSARLRVLERMRERSRPSDNAVDPDTLVDADTAVQQAPRVVVEPAGQRERRPTTQLPEGADSIMRALAELPGYSVAAYQGQRADFEARERRLVLQGTPDARARFSGQGNLVEADSSITFDDRTGRVRTTGPTLFTPDQGDPVESRALIYDLPSQRGTASEARTTYTEGATWYVQGNLDSVEQGRLFGSRARFTSCDHDPPHSYFEASQMKVVAGQVLVARGVRMYVEDVPVLWMPFIAQNLGTGRASGLLTPSFSVNDVVRTSSGYNRRLSNLGYYWAMTNYSDATLAMEWFSNNYVALTGRMRYRWRSQFLDGDVNVSRYWRDSGQQELGLNTRHNWEISERTRANVSGRYFTSSDFVNENSFDPRELTQTIDSEAGFSHRFDWGNLSVSANRRQHLTGDRIDMNLPNASLSLNTMTLFAAPPLTANWYNNLNLGGGLRFNRDVYQRAAQADTAFTISRADELRTRARANASAGLGDLSFSADAEFQESVFSDVPSSVLPGGREEEEELADLRRFGGYTTGDGLPPELDPFLRNDVTGMPMGYVDLGESQINWSTSLSYRLNLIGQTTLSPRVSMSGEMRQVDSIPAAENFVAGPRRLSTGARLQTEIYGFYPGFAGFEALRHKVTPSVTYDYSPQVRPDDLQRSVFGAQVARPRKVLTVGFNQTWEARVSEDEDAEEPPRPDEPLLDEEGEPVEEVGVLPGEEDEPETLEDLDSPGADPEERSDGLRRAPRSQVVNLLALNTNAVTYDLVEADSTGRFIDGFTTTRLSNTVRSDYLRGLDLSFEHDLFEDRGAGEGSNGGGGRRFAPHLSRVNLGFQLDHRSGLVRAVTRFLGVEADDTPDEEPELEEELPDEEAQPGRERDGFEPDRIVPGDDGRQERARGQGWSARMSYSLRRPRGDDAIGFQGRNEQLQWDLSFSPSQNWDAQWRSAYNISDGRFADHDVRLIRDLHEWEASFGFRQTVQGNWAFTFEVALRANRDLSFDYRQRDGGGTTVPTGGGGL
jgi:lipopolysaccharide assembly outer membrane protein LptD (OstA)